MFLIALVLLALALGLRRGSLRRLSVIHLRGLWIPPFALAVQLATVHFPVVDPAASAHLGPAVILITSLAVVAFLGLNCRQPGAKLAALGACLNLTVMLANGGYMPVTLEALARSGHLDRRVVRGDGVYVSGSKDIVLPASEIRFGFLADGLSLPKPIPLSASFSLGDVLIALGASTFAYRTVSGHQEWDGRRAVRGRGTSMRWDKGDWGKGSLWRVYRVHREDAPLDREGTDRPAFPGTAAAQPRGGNPGDTAVADGA